MAEHGECSSESYDKAEAWCREMVSAGHEMLFSTDLFATEMTRVSIELGISFQVGEVICVVAYDHIILQITLLCMDQLTNILS